jgi:chromosome segregation ATPase
MEQELVEVEVHEAIPDGQSIELFDPVRFEITVDQIEAKRAEYAALSAETPTGYELVRRALADCRGMRTGIEKRRKDLSASPLAYLRQLNDTAKKLTELIESFEAPLKAKKSAVDEEKARLKREKEEAERKRLEEQVRQQREAEEARLRAEREAEAQRIAEERAALEAERKRLDEERAREAEARRVEQERAEAERQAAEAKLAEERERLKAQFAEDRARLERERQEFEAERQKAAKEEAERQAKIRAEEEAKAQAERERVEAEERARRREEMRPDIEKIEQYRRSIWALAEDAPQVTSTEAQEAVSRAVEALRREATNLEGFGS